jgi:ABC-type multidrug transport system fused ATPase/permease subunit
MVILSPPTHAISLLRQALPSKDIINEEDEDDYEEEVLVYAAFLATSLAEANDFDPSHWNDVLSPYLLDGSKVIEKWCSLTEKAILGDVDSESEDEDSGEELCNIRFSLAYGGKILLHQTRLHLRRGHRYALVGENGAGNSRLIFVAVIAGSRNAAACLHRIVCVFISYCYISYSYFKVKLH